MVEAAILAVQDLWRDLNVSSSHALIVTAPEPGASGSELTSSSSDDEPVIVEGSGPSHPLVPAATTRPVRSRSWTLKRSLASAM